MFTGYSSFFVAVSVLSQSIRRAVLTAFLRGSVVFCCGDCIFTGYSSLAVSVLSQSNHVPTMITSRSDSIHSRRASMCQPRERPDQTPSIPLEHPSSNHDNVQIRLHGFSEKAGLRQSLDVGLGVCFSVAPQRVPRQFH